MRGGGQGNQNWHSIKEKFQTEGKLKTIEDGVLLGRASTEQVGDAAAPDVVFARRGHGRCRRRDDISHHGRVQLDLGR